MKSDPMYQFTQLLLLVVGLVFITSSFQNIKAEVITLTSDTFDDKVKEKDTAWFVQFCVPWCKHCKSLGNLWEDVGQAMEGEDDIETGQVDCVSERQLCRKLDIHSYPTFKLFYNGEEFAKYQGSKNVESLKMFALEEVVKAVAQTETEDDKEL